MRRTEALRSRFPLRLNFLWTAINPSTVADSKPMRAPSQPARAARSSNSSSSAKLMVAWQIQGRVCPARIMARNSAFDRSIALRATIA